MCRWNITCLSNNRPCGSDFGQQHGLTCNKDGFVTIGSNRVRDITATLLERVCPYVKGEQEKNQFSKQRTRSTRQKLKYSQDVLEKLFSWHVLSEECFTQSKNVGIRKSFAISEKKLSLVSIGHGAFTPLPMSTNARTGQRRPNIYWQPCSAVSSWIRLFMNVYNYLESLFTNLHFEKIAF